LEPGEAVAVFETALRTAIRELLPSWQSKLGAEAVARLRDKQVEDDKKRDGAVTSADLLDYTETTQLTRLVEKNWETFKPVFQDQARLKVMFGLVLDYRNPAQHNRELLGFERDLLSGGAQQVRNQVGIYRSTSGSRSRFYPVIESAVDDRGRPGVRPGLDVYPMRIERYSVGDEIVVRARAASSRSFENRWFVTLVDFSQFGISKSGKAPDNVAATGEDVELRYRFTTADVGENRVLEVYLTTTSAYHRHGKWLDDNALFRVAVDPPWDE
jgi:hypothetical protein